MVLLRCYTQIAPYHMEEVLRSGIFDGTQTNPPRHIHGTKPTAKISHKHSPHLQNFCCYANVLSKPQDCRHVCTLHLIQTHTAHTAVTPYDLHTCRILVVGQQAYSSNFPPFFPYFPKTDTWILGLYRLSRFLAVIHKSGE